MNAANLVHLDGTVHGDCWTRWKKHDGQVRFWLEVSRDVADGTDIFLVAIAPKSAEEVYRLQREIRNGRSCSLAAAAHSLVHLDAPLTHQEERPGVIFVAESCGLDGAQERNAHQVGAVRRHRLTGKMAAANDDSGLELGLEVKR